MKKNVFYPVLSLLFLSFFPLAANAEMQSPNYRIPTSVFSGGGTPTGSANYKANSTLGQSSPLKDPSDPPLSSNYNLEPGFWYTVTAPSVCKGDFEPDGDVDGLDLDVFKAAYATGDLTGDLDKSGVVDVNDLSIFASDFGRTDCP